MLKKWKITRTLPSKRARLTFDSTLLKNDWNIQSKIRFFSLLWWKCNFVVFFIV
jgi:hypothetical protein